MVRNAKHSLWRAKALKITAPGYEGEAGKYAQAAYCCLLPIHRRDSLGSKEMSR